MLITLAVASAILSALRSVVVITPVQTQTFSVKDKIESGLM